MKKLLITSILSLVVFMAFGQASKYKTQYNLIVSKLGYDGVGIETILQNWEKVDSTDIEMLTARYNYYFTKSKSSEVVKKADKKYLGLEPILTLKDSLGKDVYYFQETMFDDEYYSLALRAIERIILFHPERMDMRFTKISCLIDYEKASPDMALIQILKLIDEYPSRRGAWEIPNINLDDETFNLAIQEYCYLLYKIGSEPSYKAFKTISERMLEENKKNPVFLSNLGAYHLLSSGDYKAAMKYFTKALKINKADAGAIKNILIIARKTKDTKLEKKYLPLLIKYGNEIDKKSAEARLKALNQK